MGKPYSDILNAQRLMNEYTRYQEYRTNQGQPGYNGVGTRGQRKANTTYYIRPFDFDVPATELLEVRANPTHYTDLQIHVNGTAGVGILESPGSDTSYNVPGFSPAKVNWLRNQQYQTENRTSTKTGRVYLHYLGDRLTLPFGRDTATSAADQKDAFNEIASGLRALDGYEINRVSWIREKSAA